MINLFEWAAVIITCFIYMEAEGVREAFYYWLKNLSGKIEEDFSEHNLFTVQRACFFSLALAVLCYIEKENVIVGLVTWVAILFFFMFVHDGAYYNAREKLTPGVYPLRWFAFTKKSNSKLDNMGLTSVIIRVFLAGLGTIMLIGVFLYKFIAL